MTMLLGTLHSQYTTALVLPGPFLHLFRSSIIFLFLLLLSSFPYYTNTNTTPQNGITTDSSSPTYTYATSTDSMYTAINMLDEYGSSPQIRNACKASDLHGSLILCAVASLSTKDEVMVVASHVRHLSGKHSSPSSYERVKLIANEYIDGYDSIESPALPMLLAAVGSGIRPDFTLVVKLLRRYAIRTWERYDIYPSSLALCDATRRIMMGFMGYDRSIELGGFTTILDVLTDEYGKKIKLGRPMGVKVVLMGFTRERNGNTVAEMRKIDPGGAVSDKMMLAVAMGRDNEMAGKLLEERYAYGLGLDVIEDMLVDLLRDVVLDGGSYDEEDDDIYDLNKDWIMCEVVTETGVIACKRIPFVPRS